MLSLHHWNRPCWLPSSHPRQRAHGHPSVGLLTWLVHHLRILLLHVVVVVVVLLLLLSLLRIALLRLLLLLVRHGW